MYFDASERIARRTGFSRLTIEILDRFLAQPSVRRFEASQARELAGTADDPTPLLKEYVQERVLRLETVYLCPTHERELRVSARRVGQCDDCERGYPLEDCPSKQLYVRIEEPLAYFVNDSTTQTLSLKPASNRDLQKTVNRWKWVMTDIRSCLVTIVATIVGGVLLAVILGQGSQKSSETQPSPAPVITTQDILDPVVQPTNTEHPTQTPESTFEVTAEPIAEIRHVQ